MALRDMAASKPHVFARLTSESSGVSTPDFLGVLSRAPAGERLGCDMASQASGAQTPQEGTEAMLEQLPRRLRDIARPGRNGDAWATAASAPLPAWASGPLPTAAPPPPWPAGGPPGLELDEWRSVGVAEHPERSFGGFGCHCSERESSPPALVVSVGTVGHPSECSAACEKGICDLGAACPCCHLCGLRGEGQAPAAPEGVKSDAGVRSVGSIGHPKLCAEACKFHSKPRGCKDGSMCVRCHICRWTRYHKKRPRRAIDWLTAGLLDVGVEAIPR